jgi:preprotein translocase subunit SecE
MSATALIGFRAKRKPERRAMETNPASDETNREPSRLERWRLFLREIRNELKRVTWPSQKEVYASTVVVILMTLMMGLYLWGLDLMLDRLVFWVMRRFGAS